MNHVLLMGRLASDPSLRTTQSGTPVARFELSVRSMDEESVPDDIPIVCWKGLATFADRFLSKGRQVVVDGIVTSRKKQDSAGKGGKVIEITASKIYMADKEPQTGSTCIPGLYDPEEYQESLF